MKVAQLLEQRRQNWQELESLCVQMATRGKKRLGAVAIARFGTLYRSACADLALADAYQLPPNTVSYLHRLVGKAHNQLYRSRALPWDEIVKMLLYDAPQRIFSDRCVQLAFVLFWGAFILSAVLAYSKSYWPDFPEQLVGADTLEMMEDMHGEEFSKRADPGAGRTIMASYYIEHNTSIGLKCFATGLLVVPGLCETLYNAAFLGAVFGYMARPDVPAGKYFFQFVTAHGPFELTAIVLAAGSGLRLGVSWLNPGELTRISSLRKTAREALPVMVASVVLFVGAAFIEGFISPTPWIPYWFKAGVAVLSSGLLLLYFVMLGFPRRYFGAHG